MGQETETRIPSSGNDSGANDCSETECAKCDTVHRCVRSDAAKHSGGHTSASPERLQCSSSSGRPGPIRSNSDTSASSARSARSGGRFQRGSGLKRWRWQRSEEHTSELQSHVNLVCRLLLEKKKKN